MSQTEPAFTATFTRPREIWRDAMITCGDISLRHDSTEFGPALLARLLPLPDEGADADFLTIEVGVKPQYALRQYFASVLAMRKYPPHAVITPAMYAAMAEIMADSAAWGKVTCKTDLLARDFVIVNDGVAILTDFGNAAYEKMSAKTTAPKHRPTAPKERTAEAVISKGLYDNLLLIRGAASNWADLHHKSKTVMISYGFVDADFRITQVALDAIAAYEAHIAEVETVKAAKQAEKEAQTIARAATKPSKPAPAQPSAKKPAATLKTGLTFRGQKRRTKRVTPVPETDKFVMLTIDDRKYRCNPAHRRAFAVILRDPSKWDEINGLTKNFLLREGLVKMQNEKPAFTPFGKKVLAAIDMAAGPMAEAA